MALKFAVRYHSKVVQEDIPQLSASWKAEIRAAIEMKLMTVPETFGKPLRESLRGYRKLRVGDYRVIFRIEGEGVLIVAILHRSIVYKRTSKRV